MFRWLFPVLLLGSAMFCPLAARAGPQARVVSSPASAVTGGDALLQVAPGARVALNGADVSARFRARPLDGRVLGLISRMRLGRNVLEVRASSGRTVLTLVNHPLSGPVFSGPHQTPFVCETESFKLPDGASLGPSKGPDCWAPTKIEYLYKSVASGAFKPFDPSRVDRADIARTTTLDGVAADYVVRLETGVVNRAIYQIAILALPSEEVSPYSRPRGWNGRLIYTFGGGCGAAFRQGRGTGGVFNNPEIGNDALDRGYALASATLNVLGANCNDVTSAETAMMVKERFVETFGPPRYTIGVGGSGGSMQQNLIQANYPGILDGLLPERSYPDTLTTLVSAADCPLLHNYLKDAKGWTDAEKDAVVGFPSYAHCSKAWFNYMPRWISPLAAGCDATAFITAQEGGALAGTRGSGQGHTLYDPKTARDGVRCSYFDNAINIWGRRPDGAARTPFDNVGVQYGLAAFNRGEISFDHFAGLNRHIGGYDSDAALVPARSVADPVAIRIAYRSGRVNQGYGMDAVPIIDVRSYLDLAAAPDVHTAQTTRIARARWQAANGQADNFVSWSTTTIGSLREDISSSDSPLRIAMREALSAMDAWLLAIEKDTTDRPTAEKVRAARPSGLNDACFDRQGRRLDPQSSDGKACLGAFVDHGDPRMAAGEPLQRLYLKCALKPVREGDYARPLTAEQLQALRSIFPQGVCDYARPPVGLEKPAGVWLNFARPGGVLPAAAP